MPNIFEKAVDPEDVPDVYPFVKKYMNREDFEYASEDSLSHKFVKKLTLEELHQFL